MSHVQFNRTSNDSAEGTVIVLRDASDRRLVFKPLMVNSARDRSRPVEGSLVWQRKKRADVWEDVSEVVLAKLKGGEGVKLALNTDETFLLFHALHALYRHYADQGLPASGTVIDVQPTTTSGQLSAATELIAKLGAENLEMIVGWMTQTANSRQVLEQLARLEVSHLQQLNTLVGVTALKSALTTWMTNEENDSESFWQDQLRNNLFVLSQVFSFPVILFQEQAYVGGQNTGRQQANYLDFLLKNNLTENVALVEIKTPQSKLLGKSYRPDVFTPSPELAGAVQQIINNRENLLKEYYSLVGKAGRDAERFDAISPPALVIAGHTNQLAEQVQKKSFELYRHSLRHVQIITYDELFAKINILVTLLEGQATALPSSNPAAA